MNVLDLFSGIGGFSLGLERAGMRTIAFCDIDPFCRVVLKKHWPNVPCYDDVRDLPSWRQGGIDVVCGGFPCQDISNAGQRAGLAGERSGLWRELLRAIRLVRPLHAIVENVAALLVRGMDTVLGDLAESGYDAEWDCFPTGLAFGHRRERVWIVAHAGGQRLSERGTSIAVGADASPIFTRERFASVLTHVDPGQKWADRPLLGRGIHGIPRRVDRVRSLGNAVVPQVPEIIGRAIVSAIREAD
jgi:DNA (cytosine-5)-methyltransferase 1